jgi:hypothetical protein
VTLPVRRAAAALALGVALVTAGCGNTQANRAAVVDGTVIQETTVQHAMSEINGMQPALLSQPLTPSTTLTALIQAPVILDYLAGKDIVSSESMARQEASQRGVRDPSSGTLEIIRLATALQTAQDSGSLGQAEAVELSDTLRKQKITVNPRYGTFDPETATVSVTMPGWITPYNAAQ